jgi:hypothetical protein
MRGVAGATFTIQPDETFELILETKHTDIEQAFKTFTSSPDVGILLISQPVSCREFIFVVV